MIATLSPASRPLCSRIVNASSSACVGCSCMPSPALMIAEWHVRASRCGAPDEAWRITIMSGDIASRLRTVSSSDSPLVTLEVAVAMLRVSALSRFSAISNEVLVRVLGSKNRLTTVRPRSAGTFLIGRLPTSFIASEVSRMRVISSRRQSLDPQQVPRAEPDRGGLHHRRGVRGAIGDVRAHASPSMRISSAPSISWSRTCTLCRAEVGTFLPT